jgi:hypothetical protein
MTLTTLLTTGDFSTDVSIDLGINHSLSKTGRDDYRLGLTFGDDNSLTINVEDLGRTDDRTSRIVVTSLDPDELLNSSDNQDYLQTVIDLDGGNLTGETEQQIVLTAIDSDRLGDRELIDPLTGAVINSTNSELIVAIDTSNSNLNEENSLLLQEGSFTLNLDRDITSVAVSDPLESEDSLLSFGSINYHYSDSLVEFVSNTESEGLTIINGSNANLNFTIT